MALYIEITASLSRGFTVWILCFNAKTWRRCFIAFLHNFLGIVLPYLFALLFAQLIVM